MRGDWDPECKVYVGDLKQGTTERDLEDVFSKFGTLKNVWVAQRPPGFAFIEFEDKRDAEDAVNHLDGSRINGVRAKVQMSHGKRRPGPRRFSPDSRRRSLSRPRYDDLRRSPGRGRYRSPSPRPRYDRRSRSRSRRRSPLPSQPRYR